MKQMKYALQLLLATWLVIATIPASAQVYKHVDEDGNITFTDQPPPNSTPVEISPLNTAVPPSRTAYPAAPSKVSEKAAGSDYKVSISSPADETIIPRGPGNFSVSASVRPALATDHKLQLLVDGSAHGAAQKAPSWSLTNIFRGERVLEVAVVNNKDKQLAKSASIKVYVFRPSTNDNNRRPNARPPRPTPH
jgi:hypothetical protein